MGKSLEDAIRDDVPVEHPVEYEPNEIEYIEHIKNVLDNLYDKLDNNKHETY